MMARLYGRAVGYGSHAMVTAGFRSVLSFSELLSGFVPIDQDPGPDDEPIPGGLSRAAVFTGPLGYLPVLRRGVSHRERYAMVAPNSSVVPERLLSSLTAHATEVLVPSEWARGVLEEQTALPVRTVPHGVHADFGGDASERSDLRASYARGAFDVLHLSTSERERKGTRALVEAWTLLQSRGALPGEARLRLVLDMEAATQMVAWMAERALPGSTPLTNVAVAVRMEASPARMRQEYRAHHVLCQPSRGEGFGLCPLEALAAGVPVVATACTGHSEWFREGLPGAVRVEHGPDRPIDDLPHAVAPEVTPDAIAAALAESYRRYVELDQAAREHAAALAAEWSWPRKLGPFVDYLKEERQ